MSFFTNIKDASTKAGKSIQQGYENQQEKSAELKSTRGAKLYLLQAEYMGGFGNAKGAKGILTFYQNQTEFSALMSTKLSIPNDLVKDILVEGKEEVSRRVTVTRLLLVGIFAFALKKKSKDQESYITIELTDGQEVIFFVENTAPMRLKAKLAQVVSNAKQKSLVNQADASKNLSYTSNSDELIKLAALKEQGVLTQEEFDTEKAKLLK